MSAASQAYADKVARWSASDAWSTEAREFLLSCPADMRIEMRRKRILDVGCGTGRMATMATYFGGDADLYYGVDVNSSFTTLNPAVSLYDGRNLPFRDCFFNVTIAFHVLGHTEDPFHMLHEMLRVTRRHGWVGIVVPNAQFDIWEAGPNWLKGYTGDATIQHQFGERRLSRLLTCSRFDQTQVRPWGRRALKIGPRLRLFGWARKA